MFDIGLGEILGLAVLALLVLGPDKLPKFAADAARFLHQVRKMANTARDDVRRELGPELKGISLEDLNPRNALRRHVLNPLDLDGDVHVNSDVDSAGDRPARARKTTETQPNAAPPPYDPDTT
jgi:sec-independent protein translocase protein TatB